MHFGIHCGLVFARMGDSLHGRYELTGDAVNTAARLCAAAQRDEILVSETAMRGIEAFYDSEAVAALTLKGKRVPVSAYRVRGHSDVRTRFEASTRRGLTTFVNRHHELAQLERAVKEAGAGPTRTIGLAGGPGMGKTRVLEEFARRHAGRDVRFFRGGCESYGSVVPLQPLVQIIRSIFGVRVDMPGEQALESVERRCAMLGPRVAPHVPVFFKTLGLNAAAEGGGKQTSQRQLIAALCALIESLRAELVVLVVDDWQWVDDLSHHVLRGVVGGVTSGLLVLLAAREHDTHDVFLSQAQIIELRPLPSNESSHVIRSLLPNTLDLGLAGSLIRRSGGNPLFLEELCRSLPGDVTVSPRALEETEVPHTIHGVIQARIEKLPASEMELLRIASVIGNDFGSGLLAEVAGYPDVAPALEHLAAWDVVRESEEQGTYRFKHGITREVVYESVRLAERKRIHAALACSLERRALESGAPTPHEALAHHHLGSGDHARAAHHAELAGDKAVLASALDRARSQYGTALSELDKLPEDDSVKRRWFAVSVKWARAWVYSPSQQQLTVLERARRHAEALADLDALADVEQMATWIYYALGEQDSAIMRCRRGLALAEQAGNHKLIGQLTSNLGQCYAAAGDYPPAIESLTEAIRLKQERAGNRERSVPVGYAYAAATLASVYGDQGDFTRAYEEMERALASVSGRGHPIEASNLALRAKIEMWQGQWHRCIATAKQAIAAAERVHGPYVFSVSQAISSFARFMLEGHPDDRAKLCNAANWLDARGMRLYLSMVYACAAEASLRAQDVDAARDYAARCLHRAEQKDPFGEAVAYRVLAELEAQRGPGAEAEVSALLNKAEQAAAARNSRRERALNLWCRARLLPGVPGAIECCREARDEFAAMHMSQDCQAIDAHLAASAPA
jgi:tetratricopeptide (TPR) repeat protein